MPSLIEFCLIAGGGAVGSIIRYLLTIGSIRLSGGMSLAGTFVANLIGCFAIGLLVAAVASYPDWISPRVAIGLRVGLLGGLTTFSTFAVESVLLVDEGRLGLMLLYVAASVVLGLLAVWAGMSLLSRPQELI